MSGKSKLGNSPQVKFLRKWPSRQKQVPWVVPMNIVRQQELGMTLDLRHIGIVYVHSLCVGLVLSCAVICVNVYSFVSGSWSHSAILLVGLV